MARHPVAPPIAWPTARRAAAPRHQAHSSKAERRWQSQRKATGPKKDGCDKSHTRPASESSLTNVRHSDQNRRQRVPRQSPERFSRQGLTRLCRSYRVYVQSRGARSHEAPHRKRQTAAGELRGTPVRRVAAGTGKQDHVRCGASMWWSDRSRGVGQAVDSSGLLLCLAMGYQLSAISLTTDDSRLLLDSSTCRLAIFPLCDSTGSEPLSGQSPYRRLTPAMPGKRQQRRDGQHESSAKQTQGHGGRHVGPIRQRDAGARARA
jgi:hypothetical protein